MLAISFCIRSAFCRNCFHLGRSRHVLGILCVPLYLQHAGWWVQNLTRWKTNIAKGKLRGKNCNSTFVLNALITMGMCNVKAHPTSELRLTLLATPSPIKLYMAPFSFVFWHFFSPYMVLHINHAMRFFIIMHVLQKICMFPCQCAHFETKIIVFRDNTNY